MKADSRALFWALSASVSAGAIALAGALSCGATPVISLGDGLCAVPAGNPVTLQQVASGFTLSNGLITMTIGTNGQVTGLSKNGTALMANGQTMYVSVPTHTISASTQTVVRQTSQLIELSFVDTSGPMNWDLHYVMLSGLSGFYYFLVADTIGKPSLLLPELRTVHSFDPAILSNGFNAERHGQLPTPAMQSTFTTASEIQDDTWELPDAAILPGTPSPGEGPVYTPYDWAAYISADWASGHGLYGNGFGAWLLTANPDFVNGGPMKQEFMVESVEGVEVGNQAGSIIFNYYNSGHFGASVAAPTPKDWQKVYGPSLLYVNTGTYAEVSADAASQGATERAAWPYCWMNQAEYPINRATVDGTISVTHGRSAVGAVVALADPSELYLQGNGYMYSTHADGDGNFVIAGVRPGTYAVHVYATQGDITASVPPGVDTADAAEAMDVDVTDAGADAEGVASNVALGDTSEVVATSVAVTSGANHLGTLVWSPDFHPNELWTIGSSDRTSGEFLAWGGHVARDVPREYGPSKTEGVWDIPPENLTYMVDGGAAAQNWYFAQSRVGTWKVVFGLDAPISGSAYLTLAIASVSQNPELSVSVNGNAILDETFGNDGTLYRSAITSGRYQLVKVTFPASYLAVGSTANNIAFTQVKAGARDGGPEPGIMYDFIKLETD